MLSQFSVFALIGATTAFPNAPAPPAYGGAPPAYGPPASSSSVEPPKPYASSTTPPAPPPYGPTSSAPASSSTASCPAPGVTEHGCYSCNPAHEYPAGQTCKLDDGCYCLVYPSTTVPVGPYPTTSTVTSSTSTATCPAPGVTEHGCYSCNPAHQYPAGQTCSLDNGCYCLQYPTSSVPVGPYPTSSVPVGPYGTTSAPASSSTATCPAPGVTEHGCYSCNPAHQYPTGQTCKLDNGCYCLQYPTTSAPVPTAYGNTTAPSYPTATASCPAPGATENGCYSCNPAHQYPAGQTCKMNKGCYCLEYPATTLTKTVVSTYSTLMPTTYPAYSTSGTVYYSTSLTKSYLKSTIVTTVVHSATVPHSTAPAPSCPVCPANTCQPPVTVTVYTSMNPAPSTYASSSVPVHPVASSSAPAPPAYPNTSVPVHPVASSTSSAPCSTASCPAPGKTENGCYSCNPAHQYPAGQTCDMKNGCYCLRIPGPGVSTSPSASGPAPYASKTSSAPTASASCPAPGVTENGCYSCNPAHTYPNGGICDMKNGCYCLRIPGPGVSTSATVPGPVATSTSAPAPLTYSTSAPAPPAYGPPAATSSAPAPPAYGPAPPAYGS